jgi:hypothetical protein
MKINLSSLTLLTMLFVTLKLTNVINWSWWWVLSPMLLQFGLAFIFVLFIIGIGLIKLLNK